MARTFTYVDQGVGCDRPTTDTSPHARYVVEEMHPFFEGTGSWSNRSPWTLLASRGTKAAAITRDEIRGWEEHYARHHGLTREQFYGWAS